MEQSALGGTENKSRTVINKKIEIYRTYMEKEGRVSTILRVKTREEKMREINTDVYRLTSLSTDELKTCMNDREEWKEIITNAQASSNFKVKSLGMRLHIKIIC